MGLKRKRPFIIKFKYSRFRRDLEKDALEAKPLDPYWQKQYESMFGGW